MENVYCVVRTGPLNKIDLRFFFKVLMIKLLSFMSSLLVLYLVTEETVHEK